MLCLLLFLGVHSSTARSDFQPEWFKRGSHSVSKTENIKKIFLWTPDKIRKDSIKQFMALLGIDIIKK